MAQLQMEQFPENFSPKFDYYDPATSGASAAGTNSLSTISSSAVRHCLEEIVNIDLRDSDHNALISAAALGQLVHMEFLLQQRADVNCRNNAPLRAALEHDQNAAVILLLQKGAEIPSWALELAVCRDNLPLVATMIQASAIVTEQAVLLSVVKGHFHIFRYLVNKAEQIPLRALSLAVLYERREMVQLLLQSFGATGDKGYGSFGAIGSPGSNSIFSANANAISCSYTSSDHKHCNIHQEDDLAFRTAVYQRNFELMTLLLQHGANVAAKNNYALRLALARKDEEMLRYLDHIVALQKQDELTGLTLAQEI